MWAMTQVSINCSCSAATQQLTHRLICSAYRYYYRFLGVVITIGICSCACLPLSSVNRRQGTMLSLCPRNMILFQQIRMCFIGHARKLFAGLPSA